MKRERNKQKNKKWNKKNKKVFFIILKHFTMHDKELLNFLMIILQWYLKLNTKQFAEKDVLQT